MSAGAISLSARSRMPFQYCSLRLRSNAMSLAAAFLADAKLRGDRRERLRVGVLRIKLQLAEFADQFRRFGLHLFGRLRLRGRLLLAIGLLLSPAWPSLLQLRGARARLSRRCLRASAWVSASKILARDCFIAGRCIGRALRGGRGFGHAWAELLKIAAAAASLSIMFNVLLFQRPRRRSTVARAVMRAAAIHLLALAGFGAAIGAR